MWIGHIYYAFGLLVSLSIFLILSRMNSYLIIKNWYDKYEKVTGSKPTKSDFRNQNEFNTLHSVTGIVIIESIWVFAGLLTSNWYIFLSIMIYTLLSNFLRKSLMEITWINKIMLFQILLIKTIVYFYLIINHFHLHYDTWEIVKNWI